eukprot:4996977-Pleurochrysis_carterae.AAC.2
MSDQRRLKFLSMISYPAHLATKAQEELLTSFLQERKHLFASADRQGLRRAVASRVPQQHDPPPTSAATLSRWPSR